MPSPERRRHDLGKGPVDGLLHGGRSEGVGCLPEQLVLDIDQAFTHRRNVYTPTAFVLQRTADCL